MTEPAIGVVIPLYNRQDSVGATIESVLAQRFTDFELVVVDDCSSDSSIAVVESFKDPRIRIIRQTERRGGNAARNLGVRACEAPIISFLDSDDRYYPNKLEVTHSLFARRPDVDAVIDSYRIVYPDGGPPKLRINPELEGRNAMLEALFRRRIWKSTPGISVRRKAAVGAGLFDETLRRRQDYDFLVRLIEAANVISIGEVCWEKTRTDDSITADFEAFVPGLVEFWERHPQYYSAPGFRRGFAADVVSHWLKELKKRRFDQLKRERALLNSRLGKGSLAALVASGLIELLHLRRHRRRLQARARSSGRNGGTGP